MKKLGYVFWCIGSGTIGGIMGAILSLPIWIMPMAIIFLNVGVGLMVLGD